MAGLLSALGLSSALGAPTSSSLSPLFGQLPWAQVGNPGNTAVPNANAQPAVNSVFFPYLSPRGELWDKLLPYRLLVIDTANKNQVVQGNKPSPVSIVPLGNGTLAFEPLKPAWEFFLPITPQQLNIADIYSITTSATLKGVQEQHSGVRFKNITIQGSFGVWPGRPSISNPPSTPSALQSVFGGTLNAAQNVATQFQSIINSVTTGSLASKLVTITPGSSNDPENGQGTGYYQTIMLQQFLEQYAEAKKDPDNASWRLIFDIPKQNQSFVVTPVAFTWNENVNKPMEINYNLQLKAWRRIDLKDNIITSPSTVVPLSPGALQQILNTISAAQNTAAAAISLIGAVRSDVDNILNIVRQTGIFVKQIAGVALAASDLPAQLASDAKSTISNFIATLNTNSLSGQAATDVTTIAAITAISVLASTQEGLSPSAVSNGQLGSNAAVSATLNPSSAVFANPLQYPLLFSQVPINNLSLNTAQQNALQNELNSVSELTVANLQTMRGTILDLCIQLGNSFGAGDSYYSTLFNSPQPTNTNQSMTLDQYDILDSFYELLQAYDVLTATTQLDDNQILNNMQFVNALAATSDIEFSIPNSKIQVPVPYGLSIEQIAQRYLGDPQRWIEIATLNSLEEPYIDNEGFSYPLLSNANGRNIVIGYNEDLFIGQTIFLYSNNLSPTARTILDIVTLSQTSFLLTLDGLANLDGYTTANQAYIQAYLPNTVSSQNVIWVPSDIQAPEYDQINIPSSVANVDLVGLSKVDWAIDTLTGDLVIDNMGDFQLSAGLPNIIQSLAIKFGTALNSSLLDPGFGLPLKSGAMISDVSASDTYNDIVRMITADPRYSGISGLQVNFQPPSALISLAVQLSGTRGIFPVSFQLPTSQL